MTDTLTKAERTELASIVRLRAKLARDAAAQRHAELLADFEQQLAATYSIRHEAWADVTAEASRLVAEADAVIAERCVELGIRPEFRPQLQVSWWNRGENASKSRRDELRKAAVARLDALLKQAKTEITRGEIEARTAIAAAGLTSDEARAWLDRLPTPEGLMPALVIAEIEMLGGAS